MSLSFVSFVIGGSSSHLQLSQVYSPRLSLGVTLDLGVWGDGVCIFCTLFQLTSVAQSCPTLCNPRDCSTPSHPVHHQLPEFSQTLLHWVVDAIQPSHPLLSPSSPAFNLSQHQGLFKWVSSLHQKAKVLELQLLYQPSNEYSGLISFRMDWLDLLEVQGTLKNLLQHHSSKASILQCSAFFIV